jgi:hypothetical protein
VLIHNFTLVPRVVLKAGDVLKWNDVLTSDINEAGIYTRLGI